MTPIIQSPIKTKPMETIALKDHQSISGTSVVEAKQRLLSLDFFRGITVAAMLLVNNPGNWDSMYPILKHSEWNGCTPTDLIFSFFLFIIGVSIVYSMEDKKKDIKMHPALLFSIFRRSSLLIGIGIFLYLLSNFELAHMRIPGVLPRIALVFGISAAIYVKTTARMQLFIIFIILIGYYFVLNYVPVPGFGPANLEPSTTLGAWLDRAVFTENHLWQDGKNLDPEGLLSTIPAVATALIGILAGTYLKKSQLASTKELGKFIICSVILYLIAIIWNTSFPINKSLWTSTYVLYTASFAIFFLIISYWMIDIKGRNKLISPIVAFGRNPITAYVIAGIVPTALYKIEIIDTGTKVSLWNYANLHFFMPYFSPKLASLIPALLMLLLIFAPIWWLYTKKIIIKI